MSYLPVFEGWSGKMAVARFQQGQWTQACCEEQGVQPFHPGAMALQFGASVFEGCKAHRLDADTATTFRLRDNHARLQASCERLNMPCPSYEQYRDAIRLLVSDKASWASPFDSDWLYIRPIVMAMDDHIMPVTSSRCVFYVLTAPIRHFQTASFNLWIEQDYSRAAPGGLGAAKTAANYAHQLLPSALAKQHGCDAVIWMDPATHSTIEEASTMNVFFRVGQTVITPPLKDTILAGITRRSAIALMQADGWQVIEQPVALKDLSNWIEREQLSEAFATSTALGVRTIDSLTYDGSKHMSSSDASLSMHLSQALQRHYKGVGQYADQWIDLVPLTGG